MAPGLRSRREHALGGDSGEKVLLVSQYAWHQRWRLQADLPQPLTSAPSSSIGLPSLQTLPPSATHLVDKFLQQGVSRQLDLGQSVAEELQHHTLEGEYNVRGSLQEGRSKEPQHQALKGRQQPSITSAEEPHPGAWCCTAAACACSTNKPPKLFCT